MARYTVVVRDSNIDWFEKGGFPPGTFQNTEREIDKAAADEIKVRLAESLKKRQPLVYGRDWYYTPITPDRTFLIQADYYSVSEQGYAFFYRKFKEGDTVPYSGKPAGVKDFELVATILNPSSITKEEEPPPAGTGGGGGGGGGGGVPWRPWDTPAEPTIDVPLTFKELTQLRQGLTSTAQHAYAKAQESGIGTPAVNSKLDALLGHNQVLVRQRKIGKLTLDELRKVEDTPPRTKRVIVRFTAPDGSIQKFGQIIDLDSPKPEFCIDMREVTGGVADSSPGSPSESGPPVPQG